MLRFVGRKEDLVVNPVLDREPVQANEDRSDVFPYPGAAITTRAAMFWTSCSLLCSQ